MANVVLNGTLRNATGKKASKADRSAGNVPVVMYGLNEVLHFSVPATEFKHLVYTPEFKIADVNVGGKTYRTILQDKQFHPISEALLHVDLLILTDGHPVKYEIPVRFNGTSPGVKIGGKFLQSVRRVKVLSTPEKMVKELSADISSLGLGQSLRIRDIDAIDGVEILNPSAMPIAMVEVPRALRGKKPQEA